jgi:copper chaperone CopZ
MTMGQRLKGIEGGTGNMFRRKFLQLMTMATAAGLAPLQGMAATGGRVVSFWVQGFSCVTCATGLDTMLGQQKGIKSSKSTYPEGKVIVNFDPDKITEGAIAAFINDLGFTVEKESIHGPAK